MAGLKYRWKISPKKSYSCSLIALPRFQTDTSIVRPYRQPSNAINHIQSTRVLPVSTVSGYSLTWNSVPGGVVEPTEIP
jgi:hypothetical protein